MPGKYCRNKYTYSYFWKTRSSLKCEDFATEKDMGFPRLETAGKKALRHQKTSMKKRLAHNLARRLKCDQREGRVVLRGSVRSA